MLTLSHYSRIADTHRVKADAAEAVHERMHWLAEAHRFQHLAEIEATDPEAARRAYRPTRAYNPDMPIVREYGREVQITTAGQGAGMFDRDKLDTAYLAYLCAPGGTGTEGKAHAAARTLREEHGFLDAIRYTLAAYYLIAANISI